MTKKNKLYTVTRFNRPMFMPKENLFAGPYGNSQMQIGGTNPFGVSLSPDILGGLKSVNPSLGQQRIDFSNPIQRAAAVGTSAGLVNGFKDATDSNPFTQITSSTGGKGILSGKNFGAGTIGGAALGAGAGLLGGLANNAISGGLSSGAGNAVGSIGSTIGGAVSTLNPVAGAALTFASNLVGGVINRGWGMSVDQEKLNKVNENISALNSFTSNAGSFDEIQGPQAVSMDTDVYEGGWFTSDDAEEKNRKLREKLINAKQFAQRSVDNNINNLIDDQMNNALANYSAFGGPLGAETVFQHSEQIMDNDDNMGAIEYGFMSDYLDNKRQQAEQKSQLGNLFIGTPGSMLAFGGDLQAHGGDYSTGLTHIDAGGSHEESPYDGVQMGVDQEGTPNLVEEGEVIWDDYVFSNRINMSEEAKKVFHFPKKKDITYAEAAKRLEKEIAERPNDPISEVGFKAQMQNLEEQQELQKQQMEAERVKAAFEALSPEEQAALMQQRAAQEQAIAAAIQQPTEQEAAMSNGENPIEMQGGAGEMQAIGNNGENTIKMQAEGGHLYAEGSKIRRGVYKALGFHTDKEFLDWARKHKLRGDDKWEMNEGALKNLAEDDEAWQVLISDPTFAEAVKDNPALVDAISRGYDFGAYQPSSTDKATIQSISKGNWKATDGTGWFGSDDLAFKQATKGLTDDQIKALTTEQLADRMKATDAYKNTSKWLENSDNALLYLNTLLNDPNTPEVAKNHALQYVKDGKWKDGYTYNYNDVFGKVRANNPGTYWHTVMEANRDNQAKNFVIGENDQVDEIIGDVPADWTAAGKYSWATPENDITYNYYQRPVTPAAPEETRGDTSITPEEEEKKIIPNLKKETSIGMFGPVVGLGMQLAGIGKPDYSEMNKALASAARAYHTATGKYIGNYLKYAPLDTWFEIAKMDAASRATDRAIQNSGAPIGTKMAGLLANGYNNQIAQGELYRKANEYNDAKRAQVAEFNRGTDKYNADVFNSLSQFNTQQLNRGAEFNAQMQMQAARDRMDADRWWTSNLYGNVNSLFDNISQWEKWKRDRNTLAKMYADGLAGIVTPETNVANGLVTYGSKGGKISTKKNKKKGLTY